MLSSIVKIVVLFSIACLCAAELSSSIKKCKVNDDECIIKTAKAVIQNKNYNDVGLQSIDPLLIEKMDIDQGGNHSVTINLKFRKVYLHGIGKAQIYKISGFQTDPDKNKLEIRFKTPLATIKGPYQINGKMLVLPIQGKGDITLNLENLDVVLRFLTKKIIRDGKSYMHIEKSKFNYDVTGATVNFTNLFNGDKALGDNMNLFLNANWRILLDELKKPISGSFSEIFKNVLNEVFDKTPYNELFE